MSSITAILVAYNSESVIASALRALVADSHIAKIIAVDNASSDGTAAMVAREFPQVHIIRNAQNEGFGRGNNRALELVKTPYALLVNPDAVLEQGASNALLVAAAAYPDAAILAPQLLGEGGEVTPSYKRHVFAREKAAGGAWLVEGDICADYLSGALWLLRMTHIQKIGFFDSNIFLYYEDDDLCMRTRAAGFSNVFVHGARAMHLQGASSGNPSPASEFFKQKHMVWSRIYLQRKYHGDASALKLAGKLRVEYMIKAVFYALIFNARKLARYKGRLAGANASMLSPNLR